MMYWRESLDWAWMAPMMLMWVLVLGVVVYVAVRIANRDTHSKL